MIPILDKNYLVDWVGWDLYKQAKIIEAGRTFISQDSDDFVIKGKIDNGKMIFHPKLIFSNSRVPDIECNCKKGRIGEPCAHAVAIAIRYQGGGISKKREIIASNDESQSESDNNPELVVKTLKLNPSQGPLLQLIVLLPPNISKTAPRDSIMVKLEISLNGKRVQLIDVDNSLDYQCTPQTYSAIATVENWCQGKLGAILQLDREKMHHLLDFLSDTDAVRWVRSPDEPLEWENSRITGVHEHLGDFDKVIPKAEKRKKNEPALTEPGLEDHMVPLVDGSDQFVRVQFRHRDYLYKRDCLAFLKSQGFHLESSNQSWWLRDAHAVMNFLAIYWEDLTEKYFCEISQNLQKRFSQWKVPSVNLIVEEVSASGEVEVELSLGEHKISPGLLHRSISQGRNYLKDGEQIYILKPQVLEKYEDAQKLLNGEAHSRAGIYGKSRIVHRDLADMEEVFEDLLPGWKAPESWKQLSRSLRDLSVLKPLPGTADILLDLRPYQLLGASWLYYLYENGLGGILADEMGLGKTVQAIALFNAIYRQHGKEKPSIVVCPASLTENWKREFKKFCPKLRVFVHHRNNRLTQIQELSQYQIIITSYGLLNRSEEWFQAVDWEVILGDEAQHIKNRKTRNFKAITSLSCNRRFLMTGTPIENSLDDLRALFSFIMPGYLVNTPSKLDRDEKQWYNKRHAEQASHYVLRRTKKEVAPELPDKIEKIIYCDLTNKQESLYHSVSEQARKEIFEMEMSGANEGKIRMAGFTSLLQMRQVCADPRILKDNLEAKDSAKWEVLQDILQDTLQSGSKILLFSQFVQALKWVREELEKRSIKYCYLDGSTAKRLEEVDRFNNSPEIPIFLISTKAGGTGLNLTSADTVIHLDPWWNPAVEAQATDRAHRIGQTKTVTSIKLIASGTVEEKVVTMQQEKAKLLEDLWEASESANKSLSLDEFKSLFDGKSEKALEK